jgi:hypothetical protein
MGEKTFLALEKPIVNRLKAYLPSSMTVSTAEDLTSLVKHNVLHPAVFVIYGGMRIAPIETLTQIEDQWLTVVVVPHSNVRDGSAARRNAGPLLNKVWNALIRFRPEVGYSQFLPATPPDPVYKTEFGYFSLLWTTQFTPNQNSE